MFKSNAKHPKRWCMHGRMDRESPRNGLIAPLVVILLPVIFAFAAYGVDTSLIAKAKIEMQNAADAASLAASNELSAAIAEAALMGQLDVDMDIATARARAAAAEIAALNNVYINPNRDVEFGHRAYDEATDSWPIQWGVEPYNVVRVLADRTNPNLSAPDGQLRLLFGAFVGKRSFPLQTASTAYVEARDLVVVMDFSGSMNSDSQLPAIPKLGEQPVLDNLADIIESLELPEGSFGTLPVYPEYMTQTGAPPENNSEPQIGVTFMDQIFVTSTKDLSNVVVEYSDGTVYKYDNLNDGTDGTFGNGKDIVRCWIKSGRNDSGDGPGYGELFDNTIEATLAHYHLDTTPYPFPSGSWYEFIDYCRGNYNQVDNAGYRFMYGQTLFANYLLDKYKSHAQTPDLWKTPHYPFHAIKDGTSLLCNFLDQLNYGDEIGIVSYDTYARAEQSLNEDGYSIDISDDPITDRFDLLDLIQRHKQAAHYAAATNIGAGLEQARQMIVNNRRIGSKPTILLMTDGVSNAYPSGWTLPTGWDWKKYTDFDGNGTADYYTTDRAKQYAIYQAAQAVDRGYTIHTMTVGTNADQQLMNAVAKVGKGIAISVPGGSSIADTQNQVLKGFNIIASKVPPARLITIDKN